MAIRAFCGAIIALFSMASLDLDEMAATCCPRRTVGELSDDITLPSACFKCLFYSRDNLLPICERSSSLMAYCDERSPPRTPLLASREYRLGYAAFMKRTFYAMRCLLVLSSIRTSAASSLR
jgi:hypothetical protein